MDKDKTTKNTEEKEETVTTETEVKKTSSRSSKKKVTSGIIHIEATFNNTKILFTDLLGNAIFLGSSGAMGFKGAKKGTPFAAGKVGDAIGAKMASIGVKDIEVIIKGVGSGREPAIRSIIAHGIEIISIKDRTPVPHNGPKPKKPRRV